MSPKKPLITFYKFLIGLKQYFIWILLCCCTSSYASNLSLQYLSQVSSIVQDEQGYIWLAGQQGLTRFDSVDTLTFTQNSPRWPVPFNWIHDMVLANHHLLIATEKNGSWLFDPRTGKTTPVPINISNMSHYQVCYFQHAYFIYSREDSTLYQLTNNNQTRVIKGNINVLQFAQTKQHLYFSTPLGVFEFTQDTIKPIYNGSISTISVVNNQLFIASRNTLMRIEENKIATQISLLAPLTAITPSNDQHALYTANNIGQIQRFDANTLQLLRHHYQIAHNLGMITKLFQDSSGVLWLINSQGVHRAKQLINENYHIPFNVAINAISTAVFNSQLWLGSYGEGLAIFDPSSSTNKQLLPKLNQQLSLKAQRITDLLAFKDTLLIATFDGVWRYNSNSHLLQRLPLDNNHQIILHLTRYQHWLYIATDNNGIYIVDLDDVTKQQHINNNDPNMSGKLSSLEIIDSLAINDHQLWLATAEGLDIVDLQNKKIKNIELYGNTKAISLALFDNKIFVATNGNGIFVFNLQAELLKQINPNTSFSYIKALNQQLWAPSSRGLYYINSNNYQSTLIPNTEQYSFTDNPLLFDHQLYVAHYGGLIVKPLNSEVRFQPKVQISHAIISGQRQLTNKLIKVNSSNDVITLHLASLDFRLGQEKHFNYRINNGNWNTIIGDQLTLTGLASGIYRIEIKATNSLGQWSNQHAFTVIDVAYPWYWTPKIRFLYFLIAILIVILASWLLYLRTKSINYIHHLLKNDLQCRGKTALNVLYSLNIAKQQLTALPSSAVLNQVSELLTQSMKELEIANTNAEPNTLMGNSLASALPYFINYIQKKYHVEVIPHLALDDENLTIELQSDVYRIIFEAITSAIQNGNSTQFIVTIKIFKQKLWLTIQDDNNSFVYYTSRIHFTVAMYYIRQIANKYNASVNTYAEQEQHSQLIISIPLLPTTKLTQH